MSASSLKRHWNPLTLALLGVIVAVFGYQAGAVRPSPEPVFVPAPPNPVPTSIATFDLEKTFNALEEKKAADAQLKRLAEDMKKESEKSAKKLKAMETELEDLQPGTAKHKEMMENLAEGGHNYQAQVEFFRAKMDIDGARMMRQVYASIRLAAEQLAKERGYSVVLVNDSITPIPPGTVEEVTRQISARRMVYASPQVDVTEELISRMNSAFKTAGPAQ